MSTPWATVRLSSVLARSREMFMPLPDQTYREITMRLWGKGVVLRREVLGSEIAGAKRFVVRQGQFIVSRIDARNGALGVVPPELDQALVSNDFPSFDVDQAQLRPDYLGWLSKTPGFVGLCRAASEGTTNRVRMKEKVLLGLEIPLPPLAEQQRIVARVEEVAEKVKEVARLRKQMVRQMGALQDSAVSMYLQPGRWPSRSVGEIAGEKGLRNGKSVKPTGLDLGFYCLVLSALRNGRINLADKKPVPIGLKHARQFSIRAGDVFIMRGNGSKSLCGLAGLAVTGSDNVIFPDLFIRVPLPQTVRPAYFVAVWNSGSVRRTIEDKAKTTSGIWKVNQGHIESTCIPVPPLAEQDRIISSLERLQGPMLMIAEVQERISREHDSLLPAVLARAFKGEL